MAAQESSIGRYTMGEPEMNPIAAADPARVLTLDEIGSLASSGGKPAETLMKVVELIASRFQTEFAPPICWSRTAPTWCWRQPSAFVLNA